MRGALGLVDALRDCLSSWRRRTVMKPFLNVFRKFDEIDFRNSRFGSNHDPVRFDTADRGVFVFFAVDRFEVLSHRERCRQNCQECERSCPAVHAGDSARLALHKAMTNWYVDQVVFTLWKQSQHYPPLTEIVSDYLPVYVPTLEYAWQLGSGRTKRPPPPLVISNGIKA